MKFWQVCHFFNYFTRARARGVTKQLWNIVSHYLVLRRQRARSDQSGAGTKCSPTKHAERKEKFCHEQSESWQSEKQRIENEANAKRSASQKGNQNAKQAYLCSACGDIFDRDDLGHCPGCDHHYPAGSECGNCHKHTLRKTMKRAGFTVAEWIEKQGKNSACTECSRTVRATKTPERHAKAAAAKVNPGAVARGDKLAKERPDLAEGRSDGNSAGTECSRTFPAADTSAEGGK